MSYARFLSCDDPGVPRGTLYTSFSNAKQQAVNCKTMSVLSACLPSRRADTGGKTMPIA